MGSANSSCTMAKVTAFASPCKNHGSGQPNICPIETYISGIINANDTMSRRFISFSCSAMPFCGFASVFPGRAAP